jgi:hypothetical protein
MPGTVDPEIARDHRGVVEHPADGEAFGHEPVVDHGLDLGLVLRDRQIGQMRRGDPRARRLGQPVLGKHLPGGGVEGPREPVVEKGRVGDELGMLFPFQAELAQSPK